MILNVEETNDVLPRVDTLQENGKSKAEDKFKEQCL